MKQEDVYHVSNQFNNREFEEEVLNAKEPVLVDFWATWCGPCQTMGPVVDELAQELTDVKVGKVNVDEQMALAREYKVMSISDISRNSKMERSQRELRSSGKE